MTRVRKPATLRGMNETDRKQQAKWVRESEARKVKAGGRRMPGVVMPADVVAALDALHASGFADSATGCIYRAVIEAHEREAAAGRVTTQD